MDLRTLRVDQNGSLVRPQRLMDVQGALAGLGYRPAEIEPVMARLDAEQPAAELLKQALAALRRV